MSEGGGEGREGATLHFRLMLGHTSSFESLTLDRKQLRKWPMASEVSSSGAAWGRGREGEGRRSHRVDTRCR